MIKAVGNILQVYAAMALYFILKLPYPFRVLAFLWLAFAAVFFGLRFLTALIKKVLLPLLLKTILVLIQLLQRILLAIVRHVPNTEKPGVAADEALNRLGGFLERIDQGNSPWAEGGVRKIPGAKLLAAVSALAVVFLIIPHYMESTLTGNAKEICSEMNEISERTQEKIRAYVEQYYTPAERDAHEEETTEAEAQNVEKPVLHLNKEGIHGANLRSTPGTAGGNRIKVVSGDQELYYEGETQTVKGTVWIKVSTDDVEAAWISRKLIDENDLAAAGIE